MNNNTSKIIPITSSSNQSTTSKDDSINTPITDKHIQNNIKEEEDSYYYLQVVVVEDEQSNSENIVNYRKIINDSIMSEYDTNNNIIYCGGYKVKENDVYVRDDIGKEYCNNRIVFEGEWKDGIPDGYGKMYIDNDTCIEGIWNNGICSYSEKEYDYKNKTSRIINKKNALPLMWSEVIGIVLLFCYGSMSFCNTFDEDYLLYASYLVGIYSIALLIQQFSFSLYDKCWPLIGLVLLSSGMVLLIEVINKNEMSSMFIITTYMNIVSFIIYNYRFLKTIKKTLIMCY